MNPFKTTGFFLYYCKNQYVEISKTLSNFYRENRFNDNILHNMLLCSTKA